MGVEFPVEAWLQGLLVNTKLMSAFVRTLSKMRVHVIQPKCMCRFIRVGYEIVVFPLATLLRYVSVTFQTTTQETDPQEGPNPRWGQSFSFEVDGPVDTEFSVDLLRQITDEVHIDLFDHIEKDAELDNRLTSVEVCLCAAYVLTLLF